MKPRGSTHLPLQQVLLSSQVKASRQSRYSMVRQRAVFLSARTLHTRLHRKLVFRPSLDTL